MAVFEGKCRRFRILPKFKVSLCHELLTNDRFNLLQKNAPLQFPSKTILFSRAEVATSSEDLAINFEFVISAEF